MIDSCSLHIGCFLTCTSGVNTLSVDLLATVSGTHTIEYYFLEHVVRFEIEATIGQKFEIPTTYFNESGDARIKIVLPDGTYFTHTVDNILYDTFHLRVRASSDINFNPPVAALGVPFASQGYVDTAIAAAITALGIPFTHSLVEQVWPFEKAVGGGNIFVTTYALPNGSGSPALTGLTPSMTNRIIRVSPLSYTDSLGRTVIFNAPALNPPAVLTDPYQTTTLFGSTNNRITVWYTKP